MQKETLFVDSSVILASINFPESNSAIVFELILKKRFTAVISQKVFDEVTRFVLDHKGQREAYYLQKLLHRTFTIIPSSQIAQEVNTWRGQIKEKDLEHLATAKKLGLRILAFDRDFQPFKEYVTPKQLVKSLNLKPYETEY